MNCLFTPFNMAFPEKYSENMFALDIAMNVLFMMEILINFTTAFYNRNFELIDDLKVGVNSNVIATETVTWWVTFTALPVENN